jgi:hypothetical protein
MTSIEKINLLLDHVEKKLENVALLEKNATLRKENIHKIETLYKLLEINQKHLTFNTLFDYAAMNIAGIGLKNEDFGEIREGKYVQVIAIAYDKVETKKVTKNISLGYYGKAEKLEEETKRNIIEFVLRWRYEKSFQHSDYYEQLLKKLH